MKLGWVLDKRLMVIPVVLLLASLFIIGFKFYTTGHLVDRSIELRGGNLITVTTDSRVSQADVENLLQGHDVSIRVLSGLTNGMSIETSEDPDSIVNIIKTKYAVKGLSTETVGPVLGEVFWSEARKALIVAFVLMSITVFALFRKLGPSLAVIAAAATDMIMTVAAMNIFGIELSLATLAALLLLIGYSVDTDILLTTHVTKSGQSFEEGTLSAMKTGLTMTSTAIVALMAILVAPVSHVLTSMALVLVIGLVLDIMNTWVTNVNLLRWLR